MNHLPAAPTSPRLDSATWRPNDRCDPEFLVRWLPIVPPRWDQSRPTIATPTARLDSFRLRDFPGSHSPRDAHGWRAFRSDRLRTQSHSKFHSQQWEPYWVA